MSVQLSSNNTKPEAEEDYVAVNEGFMIRVGGCFTLGVLSGSETVAAHCDRVLQKDGQDDIEKCGKTEVDEGQPAAKKGNRTDTDEERVAEDS